VTDQNRDRPENQQGGSLATGSNLAATPAAFTGTAMVATVIMVAAGFLLVPVAAQAYPTLVNGVLLLILVGIILGHSDLWIPYLVAGTKAIQTPGGTKPP
jgi:hypothetical protein